MSCWIVRPALAASLLAFASNPAVAQGLEGRATVTLGATRLPLSPPFGGGLVAAIVEGRYGVPLGERVGVAVLARVLLSPEGRAAMADCAPGPPGSNEGCISTSTPHLFTGLSALAHSEISAALRISLGVGLHQAHGGSGPTARRSGSVEAGGEWIARPGQRRSPLLALRVARLSRGLFGARTIVLPTIGFSF